MIEKTHKKGKRHTIVYRVTLILVAALLTAFGSSAVIIRQLEHSNMDYIYRLTAELVEESVVQMEDEFSQTAEILYNLIVSDEIQSAGSSLLAAQKAKEDSGDAQNRAFSLVRASAITTIINKIQTDIFTNHAILCANFIDEKNSLQVIASTGYYKPDEAMAAEIKSRAVEANGAMVLMDGSDIGNNGKNILIIARELREKKNLSLEHIGVIALFIDMDKLGEALTQVHDGIYILEDEKNELQYVLFDRKSQDERSIDIEAAKSIRPSDKEERYSILRLEDSVYFASEFDSSKQQFSYRVLSEYDGMFSGVRATFRLAMIVLIICAAVVIAVAAVSTRRITKDIKNFISHIHHIPWENFESLPQYEDDNIVDKDILDLQQAFNIMSERINELVKENYTKQLLIKETQLSALQAQMNPHFLYNTLNSIYWMAKKEKKTEIAEMVSNLSQLLREALSSKELVIDMDKELDIACYYVSIQKQRYAERLNIEFDVSEKCSDLEIPKFTLQPLIENAIAYGVECMLEPCMVSVSVFLDGEDCVCQVKNDGPAPEENLMEKLRSGQIAPKGNGVGLLNIDKRIKAVFGEQYGITVYRMEQEEKTVVEARFHR